MSSRLIAEKATAGLLFLVAMPSSFHLAAAISCLFLSVYAVSARPNSYDNNRSRPAAPNPARRCLKLLTRTTACEQSIHSLVPHDRYTCANLSDILHCPVLAAKAGCYGTSLEENTIKDRLTARALFRKHPCQHLDVDVQTAIRGYMTDDVAK